MRTSTVPRSRALSELAERQMRTWALQLQSQERLEEERAALRVPELIRPYLVISRETGVDAAEIARRWSRVARYAAEASNGQNDEARAAGYGWQRFADAFAAANIGGTTSLGQFAGLGAGSGLPSLESFRGLHEGMARL